MDELTVEEMLDDDPGRADLSATLAAIRCTASADGVELTVDLYGKIVALRIAQPVTAREATRWRATDLAALIQRLAAEATTAAHAEALAALAATGLDCALLDQLALSP